MVKLNILNMKNFLDTVDACREEVCVFCEDGTKRNIRRDREAQNRLWEQYRRNRNCLGIRLEISNPKDYMSIVSYYAGDC